MKIKILVRKFRKEKNISLETLSKKSGVSKTHINDIENNIKSPSLYVMVRLARALKVDITELYKVRW